MWINKLYLPIIHSQSWGTMWVDRSCLSLTPQLATCGPLINPALFKWQKNWHKGAQSHAKWSLHHALPIIWFEIFSKFMQKLKFRVPFVKHLPKSLLASHLKHMMVWWYIILWPQNTICTNWKVSYILQYYSQILVNRCLTKSSRIHN